MDLLAQHKICETCGSSVELEMPSGFCPACLLSTALEGPQTLAAGSSLEDYELLNEIARGGMGIVYRARQRAPSRVVAVKMILPAQLNSPGAVNRFRAEAETAASLEHANILPIYVVGSHNGTPFFSMKFADGGTLSERIDNYRDNPRAAAALIATVAGAVAYAHERGVLHRDLKPANVLFDATGKPYVSDFGLAKWLQRECDLTQTISILGTPFYMAPEQATDPRTVTAAADIYSLGAILYHLLTGHPPFGGDTPIEILHRAASETPESPRLKNRRVSLDLETICLKCLEKQPSARYQSAAALAEDIERFCADRPILARPLGPTTRAWRWLRRNPVLAMLGTITLALLVVIAVLAPMRREMMKPVIIPEKSIAVLPFENLSLDPNNAYVADGIQEEILTRLAGIADLKVISRTSTQRYQSRPRNLAEIAKQLGVANVLEGSVQKATHQVRVNVQLISALSGTDLWAETYDRQLTDIFAVESDVAKTIAETLQAKLTRHEKSAIVARPTEDSVAHDFYLRGRYFLAKRTKDDFKRAIYYFNQAIARDTSYALAYAGLADSYVLEPQYSSEPASEALPKARSAAEKALALDANLAEAHISYGLLLFTDLDWAGTKRELLRAIELSPNSAAAHYLFGYAVLTPLGQFDRAIAEIKRAIELDPLSVIINANLGDCFFHARHYPEAIAQARKAVELDPNFPYAHIVLGNSLRLNGDMAAAKQEYEAAYKMEKTSDPTGFGLSYLAHLYALQGNRDKALELLGEAQENQRRGAGMLAANYGLIYLALGDKDQAMTWFERSYQSKEVEMSLIRVNPFLDPLRGNPRFKKLANQIIPPGSD